MAVTLVNLFCVSDEMESKFIESWHKTAEQMEQQPGFIDSTLHRNLEWDKTYQYINVAHWESSDAFREAQQAVDICEKKVDIEAHPALYTVEAVY